MSCKSNASSKLWLYSDKGDYKRFGFALLHFFWSMLFLFLIKDLHEILTMFIFCKKTNIINVTFAFQFHARRLQVGHR